jgi:hypothetical protein
MLPRVLAAPAAFGAAAALLAILAGGPARAVDWSLAGSVSQRFEASQSPSLDVDDEEGFAYGSVTSIGAVLGARTPSTDWSITSSFAVSAFGGEGATDDLTRSSPSVSGRVTHEAPGVTVGANASFSRRSTSFLDLDIDALLEAIETGELGESEAFLIEDDLLLERSSVRTAYRFGGDASMSLTPLDTLGVSADGQVTRFSGDVNEDEDLVGNSSFGGRLSWGRRLSEISEIGVGLTGRRFTADDPEETAGFSLSASLSYGTDLSPTLGVSGSAGLGYARQSEFVETGGARRRETETDLTFSGSLGATYRATEDTVLSLRASQGVLPSDTGTLRNVTSFGATLNQALTSLANLSVSAQHSLQSDIGSEDGELEQALFFSPVLSYAFAPQWRASLGYSLRMIDDEDGIRFSNRVFLGVTRSLNLFR